MKKIEQFQITSLMLSGFKSYEEPTELVFGNPTVITGGNGRGKSSIADAIAFAVTGCPFFGERGIDRLHNENNPDVAIRMCLVDETGTFHELNRTRRKNRMTITYDGYEIRQLDLADLFGERDVFLSIFNPLYFIEELGEDGKKLLERYLPTIPHETVLSQLSEPVREHLKNETILSPEGSLKRCREEIRGLEERITYLRGQKDLAASQGESHEQAEQELTLQADTLREEIAELEQRQFSGMDVSDMQERLVELSERYEEAARDERADTSKLREQLQTLREKIARREGEQYQSKFTEALAEASARVKDLGVRYQRESAAYKAFHAGMECPACHRSVTEQSLPEVQAALKKVLSELYAAGSEQRAQLIELQEMDKKAADTFAQFKEDDLGKWAAEAAEMEQRCASLAEQASAEMERLRAEIQTLTADLEYGNLSQAEYDHLGTCREKLRQSEAKIAALQTMTAAQLPDFDREIAQANASIAEIKRKMANVIAYISKRAELTFSQLKMNRVEISLYMREEYKLTEADRNASFIFLLDGFNEIPTTTMQIRCLRDILDISDKKYPEAAIILSNRDPLDTYMDLLEYENGFDADQIDRLKFYFHNCYIKELSQEQIDDYFEPNQRCLVPAARNILDTPFYLVLYRQAMQPSGKDAGRWITDAFQDHLNNGTPEKTTLMLQMLLREIDNLRSDITSAERELSNIIGERS